MDSIPEREVYTIAILHRRPGQTTIEEMCRNPSMTVGGGASAGAGAAGSGSGSGNGSGSSGSGGGDTIPGFIQFIRGLGTPHRTDQPELEFHVPTFMSVPPERYVRWCDFLLLFVTGSGLTYYVMMM